MSADGGRAQERRWLVASAVLFWLAFHPYAFLPGPLEGLVPAVLILLAPAPLLAAFARGGGIWRGMAFGALWWAMCASWLLKLDPILGLGAWAGMIVFAMCLCAPLGWGLGWLRQRLGPSGMLWLAPAFWCGWEMVRTWTPIGNPFFSLGHAFWKLTPLIQIADLGSYFLVSFVICTVAAGLARLLLGDGRAARRQLLWGAGLLLFSAGYGWVRQFAGDEVSPLHVALVQANIPTHDKDQRDSYDLLLLHEQLTRQAPEADLIVWPETAINDRILPLPHLRRPIEALAREQHATLITGGIDTAPRNDPTARAITNGAMVFGPDGTLLDVYRKVHLVILGEYLPLREWPIVKVIARYTPQFWAGDRFRAVDTPVGRLGLPICYEIAFPQDTRAFVRDGAEALVALTNDDQLTETGARQFYQQCVFRSIENRRWLARCANSGISAFVDPYGYVTAASAWNTAMVKAGTIDLPQQPPPPTFYTRFGPVIPTGLLVLAMGVAWLRPRRSTTAAAQPDGTSPT